ncbi:hypothetical protein [Aquisphaera insulae]|uniref:hypothetical protein n=1 Tax=Aquisphaera insulae TaxID=2712864 RepID=UPI0013EBB3A4|nr:hypothetical protein [Aquisphaera insulae]
MIRAELKRVRRWQPGVLVVVVFLGVAGCESSDVGTISVAKSSAKKGGGEPEGGTPVPAKGAKKDVDEAATPTRAALPKAAQRKG